MKRKHELLCHCGTVKQARWHSAISLTRLCQCCDQFVKNKTSQSEPGKRRPFSYACRSLHSARTYDMRDFSAVTTFELSVRCRCFATARKNSIGGMRTFAAGARISRVESESRRSERLKFKSVAASPPDGLEPMRVEPIFWPRPRAAVHLCLSGQSRARSGIGLHC